MPAALTTPRPRPPGGIACRGLSGICSSLLLGTSGAEPGVDCSEAILWEGLSEAVAPGTGAGGPAAITVRAWDSESTGIGLPKELPTPGTVYAQSLPAMSEGGGQRWTYFRPDPGLTVFDSRTQAGIYWVPAASSLTYGDIAGGFFVVTDERCIDEFDWWL